jgi:hypothetical protein
MIPHNVRQLIVVRDLAQFQTFDKRLVKTPKLYFLDSGLAAWLMGIRDAKKLETHASRGALFETWCGITAPYQTRH